MKRARINRFGFVAIALVAAIYITLPDRQYRDDILAYSLAAETGENLFRTNHLFYSSIVRASWQLHASVVPDVRALDTANILSLIFGLPTVLLFYLFNVRLTNNHVTSALYTLGFAFAYDTWTYATSGETYIIPIFFMILSYYMFRPDTSIRPLTVFAVALMIAVASFIHQSYVLLLIPLCLHIWIYYRAPGPAILVGVGTGVICVAVYAVVGFKTQDISSLSDLVSWARGYVGDARYGHFITGVDTFLEAGIGFGNGLVDLKRTRNLLLDRGQLSLTPLSIAAIAGLCVIGIALCAGALRTVVAARHLDRERRHWFWMLLFHLVFFSIVAIYWLPTDHKFWAPVMFSLFTLLNLGMVPLKLRWRRNSLVIAGCLVAAILLINALVGVHRVDETDEYETARSIVNAVPRDALVLLPDSHVWNHVEYFFPEQSIAFNSLYATDGTDAYAAALAQQIRDAHLLSGGLYISEDELVPSEWRQAPFVFLGSEDYAAFYEPIIEDREKVLTYTAFGAEYSLYRVTGLRDE